MPAAFLLVGISFNAQAAVSDVVIDDYTLVSKKRISRFAYEFVYRAHATNTSSALAGVQAALDTPVPAGMTPIDDVLDLGDMDAGASASAEFSFRQDRRFPLYTENLAWIITGSETENREPIQGDPSATVVTAIQTTDTNDKYAPEEVSTDSVGRDILRTQLKIRFHPWVTVAEANALLNRVGASVTNAIAGVPLVVVHIPDPGDLQALDQLVSSLLTDPVVLDVETAVFPQPLELPDNYSDLSTSNIAGINHHLAVGAHAAWNAIDAAENTQHVIIMDFFGGGAPKGTDIPHNFETGDFGQLTPADPSLCVPPTETTKPPADCPAQHGYHVLGIIAGEYGGSGSGGLVTGLAPVPLELAVIDLKTTGPLAAKLQLLTRANLIANSMGGQGYIVANTSVGYVCDGDDSGQTCTFPVVAKKDGGEWASLVRSLNLEDRLLHATAAGNVDKKKFPSARDAETGFWSSAAALRQDLIDHNGVVVPPVAQRITAKLTGISACPNADIGLITRYIINRI